MTLLPRPYGTSPVKCPSCEHGISNHAGDILEESGCSCVGCKCDWTPNDISWFHLFGGLTPVRGKIVLKPDGSWADPEDWS